MPDRGTTVLDIACGTGIAVLPFTWRTTVKTWVGDERSRARARNAFGAKRGAYLKALERRSVNEAGSLDSITIVPDMQDVYMGVV